MLLALQREQFLSFCKSISLAKRIVVAFAKLANKVVVAFARWLIVNFTNVIIFVHAKRIFVNLVDRMLLVFQRQPLVWTRATGSLDYSQWGLRFRGNNEVGGTHLLQLVSIEGNHSWTNLTCCTSAIIVTVFACLVAERSTSLLYHLCTVIDLVICFFLLCLCSSISINSVLSKGRKGVWETR